MADAIAQQCQQEEEHQWVLRHLTEQQGSMIKRLVATQAQMSQQLCDLLGTPRGKEGSPSVSLKQPPPMIRS